MLCVCVVYIDVCTGYGYCMIYSMYVRSTYVYHIVWYIQYSTYRVQYTYILYIPGTYIICNIIMMWCNDAIIVIVHTYIHVYIHIYIYIYTYIYTLYMKIWLHTMSICMDFAMYVHTTLCTLCTYVGATLLCIIFTTIIIMLYSNICKLCNLILNTYLTVVLNLKKNVCIDKNLTPNRLMINLDKFSALLWPS
jgi:hypothetical protein